MSIYLNNGTIILDKTPSVLSYASAVGKMENDGPLSGKFDYVSDDVSLGEDSWELAESHLQQHAIEMAVKKMNLEIKDLSFIFAGDLQNQCASSSTSLKKSGVPFVGLYGACSTMAESLSMASIFADAGIGRYNAAMTSSHFCSAERQFRLPLNYGGQRTPTAQWTATGSGCVIVGEKNKPPYIKAVTIGIINDYGIKDANNMGAAMAPAAYDTISRHMTNTGTSPDDYDLILTGDLGVVGGGILRELFEKDGIELGGKYNDCGIMLYDIEKQDVHAGASGCGCSASVLCADILGKIASGELKNVLFAATGALMSPTIVQQGESISGISHAVHISFEGGTLSNGYIHGLS